MCKPLERFKKWKAMFTKVLVENFPWICFAQNAVLEKWVLKSKLLWLVHSSEIRGLKTGVSTTFFFTITYFMYNMYATVLSHWKCRYWFLTITCTNHSMFVVHIIEPSHYWIVLVQPLVIALFDHWNVNHSCTTLLF